MNKKILVVEDDTMLNSGLCYNLESDGYAPVSAYSTEEALKKVKTEKFDLIVLDVNLPDGSGFDLFKKIRNVRDIPTIFLTACDLEKDVMEGYELGADDYITKPFSINVFRKKISAILRRCGKRENENIYTDGNITVDFGRLTVEKNGESAVLTPTECKMLKIFIANPNTVITRQTLVGLRRKFCR